MIALAREIMFSLRNATEVFGASLLFFLRTLRYTPHALLRPRLIIEQIYATGAQSLVIIMICGLFVGMVIGLQGYNSLARFGAEDSLGGVAALALFRELSPVMTALLFSGRAGTALASEIGLMRATSQLSAMEMMAVDPIQRVVVPRFIGGVISMPLLAAIFSAIGVFGAYLVGVGIAGVEQGAFWSQMQEQVDLYEDLMSGLIKSLVFGVATTFVAVFEGYNAIPTAEGVSRATTRTVVIGAIATLVLDFILTAIMFKGV